MEDIGRLWHKPLKSYCVFIDLLIKKGRDTKKKNLINEIKYLFFN
jgi:hypothetical protein